MAEVRTVFTSDDAELQKTLEKMHKEMGKLQDKNRQLAAESRSGSRSAQEGVDGLAASIGRAAHASGFIDLLKNFEEAAKKARDLGESGAKGGEKLVMSWKAVGGAMSGLLVGAGGFAGLATAAHALYEGWQRDLDATLAKVVKLSDASAKQIGVSGKVASGPQVEQFLKSLTGATREQGLEALTAVQGAAPEQTLSRQFAIADQVTRLAPMGFDLKEMGALTGKLAELMPEKTATELANLATVLKQQTGASSGQLQSNEFLLGVQQLVKSGAVKSTEEGLALGAQAVSQNISPGVLTQIAAAVGQQVEKREDKPTEASKARDELVTKISQRIGASGDLTGGQQIEGWLKGLSGSTREQGLQALEAVQGAGPGDIRRQMAIAAEVSRLAPLHDVGALGKTAGELGGLMPGRSAGDVTNVALALQQQLGGDAGKLSSSGFVKGIGELMKSGAFKSSEQALAFGAEAAAKDISPGQLTELGKAIGTQFEITKPRSDAQFEEMQQKKAFNALPPGDRLKTLMSNEGMRKAILGGDGGLGGVDLGKVNERAELLSQAQAGKLADFQLSQFAGTEAGRRALVLQQKAVAEDKTLPARAGVSGLSDQDRLVNQFAGMSADQRLQSLLASPDMQQAMLGSKPLMNIKTLSPESVATRTGKLVEAQQGDGIASQLAQFGESDAGARALRQQEFATEKDRYSLSKEWRAKDREEADERMEQLMMQRDQGLLSRAFTRTAVGTGRFGLRTTQNALEMANWLGWSGPPRREGAEQELVERVMAEDSPVAGLQQAFNHAMNPANILPGPLGAGITGDGILGAVLQELQSINETMQGVRRDSRTPATLSGAVEQ